MAVKRKAGKKHSAPKRARNTAPNARSKAPAAAAIDAEPERDKATGAIGPFSQDVQQHTGPVDPKAERTAHSLQRFTNSTLPKGPWLAYTGRPDTPFAGEARKACRISGLFVCVGADGAEVTCEDGYVIYDEPGRHPCPVPAFAFENNFALPPEKVNSIEGPQPGNAIRTVPLKPKN